MISEGMNKRTTDVYHRFLLRSTQWFGQIDLKAAKAASGIVVNSKKDLYWISASPFSRKV